MLKPNQTLTRSRQASHRKVAPDKPKKYTQKEITEILKHTEFLSIDEKYSIVLKK